jgi:type II secretory pathway pseudopilin PulG
MPIVLGVLGIVVMRSWGKMTGKARHNLQASAASVELESLLQEKLNEAKREKETIENTTVDSSTGNIIPSGNVSIDKFRQASQDPNFKPKSVFPDELYDD